jgi:hypothetical protein
MEKAFELGDDLIVNKHIIYPGDLNKENLLKFTLLILENFSCFHKENIEVQVRNCFDQKSIEWQIKTFYYEKGFCLDKTYTFTLLPDWTMELFYEHAVEPLSCHRLKEMERVDIHLKIKLEKFLTDLAYYYSIVGPANTNRFLNTASWKVIYAKSIKEDQIRTSESRIQEYLKFITKPISSFKN